MDARDFKFPEEPLVLYLFNPFPDYVMKAVLQKLENSLRAHPRKIFLLYNTPWDAQVVAQFEYLKKISERENFQLYEAVLP
jgi:hypothetical protein